MGVMLLGVTKEGRETGDEMRQLALFVISFSRDSKWAIYEFILRKHRQTTVTTD